jgi:hypothetical protein
MSGFNLRGAALSIAPLAVLAAVAGCATSGSVTSGSTSPVAAGSGGAGSGQPAPPRSSGLNSCTVISQAEAGAALGQTVRAPVRGHATVEGGVACVYYGPDVPAGISADIPVADSVRVVLVTGPKAAKYFNDYRSKVSAQPISGLGDKAFYDGFASISVLKGDRYVRIAVGIVNPLSAEKKLAADAVARM